MEVPKTLSSGRKSFGSVTVPAFVTGTLKGNGELKIEKFRLGVDEPAGGEQLGKDAGTTASSEQESFKSALENLSQRENEILSYIQRGFSNKRIAQKLAVTEATVKVHIKAILRKMEVSNRSQAVMWATKHLPK